MWLFIAFIAVPLIEIALFIQVGGFIGLWPTLGIVVVTAVLGRSKCSNFPWAQALRSRVDLMIMSLTAILKTCRMASARRIPHLNGQNINGD